MATPFSIYVPPISLTITATNPGTLVTNNIINCLNIGGSNYIISSTFIYSAATMGTNFTTNWAGYYIPCTNYTFGQAIPQTGTNPVSIK